MNNTKKIIISLFAILIVSSLLCCSLIACNKDNSYNYIIGIQEGTTGEDYVKSLSNVDHKSYDTGVDAVNALLNDQADFVVIDITTAQELVKANNGKIKLVDIKLSVEEYGIGVDKNQPEILTAVNNVLNRIIGDGTLDTIIDTYTNGGTKTGYTSADPNEDMKDSEFVVALNAEFAPFEYKEVGKYYGIDIEIAKLIADELQQTLVIYDCNFDDVISSVGGIADVAISGLTITEERKLDLDFSVPYFQDTYQTILVKADSTLFDNCKTEADFKKIINN